MSGGVLSWGDIVRGDIVGGYCPRTFAQTPQIRYGKKSKYIQIAPYLRKTLLYPTKDQKYTKLYISDKMEYQKALEISLYYRSSNKKYHYLTFYFHLHKFYHSLTTQLRRLRVKTQKNFDDV